MNQQPKPQSWQRICQMMLQSITKQKEKEQKTL